MKASPLQVRATGRGKASTRTAGLGSSALNLIHVKCFISRHREGDQLTGFQCLMWQCVQIFYFYAKGHTPMSSITKTFMNIAALASDRDSG